MQHSIPEQKLETSTLKNSATIVQLQTLLRLERCLNQIQHRKARFAVTNPTVKADKRHKSSLSFFRLVNLCFCYASEQSIFTLATRYVYALVC